MHEEVLYTADELASKLKLSKYTIYEMIKRGDIEAHHIGRSIRVSQSQLERYLMSTGKVDNVYEAEIIKEGNSQYSVVDGIKICVVTNLEEQVKISIRPEDIILCKETFISSARNIHKGIVEDIILEDRGVKVLLNIGIPLQVLITRQSMVDLDIEKGDELYAVFKTMSVIVLK